MCISPVGEGAKRSIKTLYERKWFLIIPKECLIALMECGSVFIKDK
ncbi:hypothetical protein HMPREF1451_01465 [Helicobacter pylori HP260BFii]|uniref:Uncharacterized protein n=1 Tax=Helicobacter pylori GAM260BSi TaxID=1159046 RepID=M3QWN8_HELPX|nr:hypothetical protein HMPREF1418_00455 [Helicobacter pylori GAM260BSi]EMH66450.1 hypothetical protein HMPREF1451_01465 [Helicobacter pylori HP260BFii]